MVERQRKKNGAGRLGWDKNHGLANRGRVLEQHDDLSWLAGQRRKVRACEYNRRRGSFERRRVETTRVIATGKKKGELKIPLSTERLVNSQMGKRKGIALTKSTVVIPHGRAWGRKESEQKGGKP